MTADLNKRAAAHLWENPPAGHSQANGGGEFSTGGCRVPVSMAAKDWKVTPRRIRFLLNAGRLEGHRGPNGCWLVSYPYRFTFGARGTGLKRFQRAERGAE